MVREDTRLWTLDCRSRVDSGGRVAAVLCDPVVKVTLFNYARNFVYTTGPTFMDLAAVRAAYRLVQGAEGDMVSSTPCPRTGGQPTDDSQAPRASPTHGLVLYRPSP